MFGLSFGELVVVVIVGVVVIGPKDLPRMLHKLGRLAGDLRRMATSLRVQSGIDDVLRTEGLSQPIEEIRKLARGELDAIAREANARPLVRPAHPTVGETAPPLAVPPVTAAALPPPPVVAFSGSFDPQNPIEAALLREHEYPPEGADSYGALPDDAPAYGDAAPSPLSEDPLYSKGIAS